MSTIRDKLYFNFDGIPSSDFNIVHVNLDSGLFDESFVSPREVIEKKTMGNDNPIFNRVDYTPLEFELHLAFTKPFTDESLDELVKWMFVDYYKPLYFYGNTGKIVYCMPSGDSRLVHTGYNEGYITINMKCSSPFYYSPIILSDEFDLTTINTKTITLPNKGHFDLYPEISIKSNGVGKIEIISKTNRGRIFEVRNLYNQEGIYINTKREIIESDIIGVNKYGSVIGEYPVLLYGENNFQITGNCKIQFRYQYVYKY